MAGCRSVVRTSATLALLVVLYFVLPMEGNAEGLTLLWLVAGLLVLSTVIVWHVRAIVRSRYPGVRAAQALVTTIAFLLLVFASTYYLMGQADHANFRQQLTRSDTLYFTVTAFSTVRFGDITATSQPARIVVILQIIIDLVFLGAVLQLLLGAARMWRARRQGQGDGGDSASHQS